MILYEKRRGTCPKKQGIAVDFYETLFQEVSESYESGKCELSKIVG